MNMKPCPICEGQGCEEGCGNCQMAHAGPESHKVCRNCGGRGSLPAEKQIQYMDVETFRALGFLQEANRQFFHPHGLALEWNSGFTKEGVAALLERSGVRFGEEAQEHIWTFIKSAGLDRPRISGIWDDRDDPEGIAYGRKYDDGTWHPWDTFDSDEVRTKAELVDAERAKHVTARCALFGVDHEVQTIP